MTEKYDAEAALAAVRQSDHNLSRHIRWPFWRHAAAGLLQAILVFTWAVPMPWAAITLGLGLFGIWAIAASDRKLHGMFVNGWTSTAARPAVWLAIAATLAGFAAISMAAGEVNRWTPLAIPIALAVFLVVTVSSIWWERLYRAELTRNKSR